MSGTSEPASTDNPVVAEDPAEPQDDVKRRFRDALDRKQAKSKSGENHANGPTKIHEAHGPVGGKRTFRRKSG